ncbi:hypothetical protein [Bacillus xiapuensis]|uniref:Spore coat protein B n=1 Tax=Bacillus xiapuensis TaxID=2014075 RepID=A0ABU6NDC8_9BACI|nr:hypothetical protein [Bacillus xiapuensis]
MNKEMMSNFVGKTIRVDRHGPNSRVGKLMEVFDDGFVLLTEKDGVLYYCMQHIKSITESTQDKIEFGIEIPDGFEYKKARTFMELLRGLQYQWVHLNRGPESIEGVLSEVHPDYVSVIVKDEIVRLARIHLRNISYGLKIESDKDEEKDSDNKGSNDKGSKNKNSNDKSSNDKNK